MRSWPARQCNPWRALRRRSIDTAEATLGRASDASQGGESKRRTTHVAAFVDALSDAASMPAASRSYLR